MLSLARLRLHLLMATAACTLAACGGKSVPTHNGYKSAKVTPWKKPKVIVLNEEFAGKADGNLDYAAKKRARWFAVDLPSAGELTVSVEAQPSIDADDFDLGFEIFDPANEVAAKGDYDDEDAKETSKKRTITIPGPGRYLLHLYLQRRLDTSDFELAVDFDPVEGGIKTDFPAKVAFYGDLAQIPVTDDTPANRVPKPKYVGKRPPPKPKDIKPKIEPASTKLYGSILKVSVVGSGTEITFSRAVGVEAGMSGYVTTVKTGGSFKIDGCGDRTCKAVVGATPDQIGAGRVVISP